MEFDDAGNLIYWPQPPHDAWLSERGFYDQKQELARQRKHTKNWLHERNKSIPDIILLNTKHDDHFPPRGAPISYDELSVDYYAGRPCSESEGDEAVSTPPDYSENISPEGATTPNTLPEGVTTPEGTASPRLRRKMARSCMEAWRK